MMFSRKAGERAAKHLCPFHPLLVPNFRPPGLRHCRTARGAGDAAV